MGALMYWPILLLQLSSALVHGYDNVGFDGWYQPVPHRPVDIITDVINDLGVRILQQYTARGNVAFSPAGVGFVLAALYEGSVGRGRQQIADALGLPRDRDVTRIGFRDIHRRLRTYLNADGFLGGLTLNQENTKLRPEYEDILRFYGFDLSTPEEEETNDTTTVTETTTNLTTEPPVTVTRTSFTDETTVATTVQSTKSPEIVGDTAASTVSIVELLGTTSNTVDEQERFTLTTPAATTLTDAADATLADPTTILPEMDSTKSVIPTTVASTVSDESFTTIVDPVQTTIVSSSNEEASTSTAVASSAATSMTSTLASTLETSSFTRTMEGDTGSTILDGQTDSPITTTVGSDSDAAEPVSGSMTTSTIAIAIATTIASTDTPMTTTTGTVNVTEATASSTISDSTQANQTIDGSTNGPPPVDASTVSTGNDRTASNEMGSTDSLVTTAVGTGEIGSNEQLTTTVTPSTTSSTMNRRKRNIRSPRGFFSSYPDEGIWIQDLGIWKPYSTGLNEASVRESTEISFLVNGCDVSSVTASRYIAVLPFAYFPSLHAVALEFPLDDPRYNILLMMATDRRDTYRLARDLGGKSLRLLRKQLQATWVRATIPSFMLRGFVTLTSFLQRLGILDVFEPRAADLSLMTPDLGVYARDVQQSIGVNIRNYMKPDRTHSRNGLLERAEPAPFMVIHPFLYFIVDAETSVALIAGRVNDPLNSRIL